MTGEWTKADDEAAEAEGWGVYDCAGSMSGPVQVQTFDDEGGDEWAEKYGRPYPFPLGPGGVAQDHKAWDLILAGLDRGSELHQRVMVHLLVENPLEHFNILQWRNDPRREAVKTCDA